jgi:hypothetical protein
MTVCTDNPRLGLVGCGQTYSGKMCHSVARVPWSSHPDGRAHATFPSNAMADRCWRGDRMHNPAGLVDAKRDAVFRQDARGIWRGAEKWQERLGVTRQSDETAAAGTSGPTAHGAP